MREGVITCLIFKLYSNITAFKSKHSLCNIKMFLQSCIITKQSMTRVKKKCQHKNRAASANAFCEGPETRLGLCGCMSLSQLLKSSAAAQKPSQVTRNQWAWLHPAQVCFQKQAGQAGHAGHGVWTFKHSGTLQGGGTEPFLHNSKYLSHRVTYIDCVYLGTISSLRAEVLFLSQLYSQHPVGLNRCS